MFTPGFRLFFGFALAGLTATFVYGVASGNGDGVDYLGFIDAEEWIGALSLGWSGGVGDHVGYVVLLFFAVACAFLAFMLVSYRDADPDAVAELAGGELPPAQSQTVGSYWPLIGAFGAGVTIVGLVSGAAIFIVGLIILAAATFEWMMACWADRATGDPVANQQLRNQVMGGIEMPILAGLGIAALILAFSRVFLAVSHEWAVWVATILAAVIFLVAVAFAVAEKPNKNLVAGVVAFGCVAALAGGVVAASVGERDFHEEEEEHSEDGDNAEEGALG